MKKEKVIVFIGRFQPFHIGHYNVVKKASEISNNILILVGSSYRARSWKNPFKFSERKLFIQKSCENINSNIGILPLVDTLYNDRTWANNVRSAVNLYLRNNNLSKENTEVILTGYEKDNSSMYLKWFPEWDWKPVTGESHNDTIINAKDFREDLFFKNNFNFEKYGNSESINVLNWMNENPGEVKFIKEEAVFCKKYKEKTKEAEEVFGYPIPINTADAVVIQSGHVLLVKRGVAPGKGLMALPGGHINRDETSFKAAIRELYEECRLDMPKGAMQGRVRKSQIFDHPERSERGWVRTEAFLFELEDRKVLEKVKAGDDAASAVWVPITEITPDDMFEDHFDIIQTMVPDVPFAYSSIVMAHT
jgi:bifunctional NMN adenylyltransferase/nudix hydrolase